MVKYEWKKIFSRTGGRAALVLLFVFVGITCLFAADISRVDENGEPQTGPAAVAALKEARKAWAGELDEERIREVIAENRRIQDTPEARSENVTENNIAYGWQQGIEEIRDLLNCSYAAGFREHDYYRANSVTEEEAALFYENRVRLLQEWLADEAKDQFTEQEKAYLVRQYETIPTPFSYDYITGWKQLFTFAPTVVMLTMLVLGYLVAGIFSGEFAQKADAVFFTSIYGRDRAVLAKIQAGFLAVTSVYFAAFLLYTAAVLLYLGADGWNLAVQVDWGSWKCFYHLRIWQKYLLILVGGYLGCLFLSFLGMLVSAKTRSSVPAVMVPVLLIFLPSFLGNLDSPVVSKVISLLPDQLLQAGTALDYFELYTIGGKVLGAVPILLTVYTILTILLLPALYQGYRRKEIG